MHIKKERDRYRDGHTNIHICIERVYRGTDTHTHTRGYTETARQIHIDTQTHMGRNTETDTKTDRHIYT